MILLKQITGLITILLLLTGCTNNTTSSENKLFAKLTNKNGISEILNIFTVDKSIKYEIDGEDFFIGAGFQPSVILDSEGAIHVFFQARLNNSADKAPKMIAHVVSHDGGRSFSKVKFVNSFPMQTYAISSFVHTTPEGKSRISLLTSLSIDETISRMKDAALIKEKLGIDVTQFTRRGAALILEFYSDDNGTTWKRKEHYNITDRVYERNGKKYYLAFMNLIGQIRKIEDGPYKGRLILAGPLRGNYLPADDYPKFRNYNSGSSIIFSDDNGMTWKFGGMVNDTTAFTTNEASAVPVNNGNQILMVQRMNRKGEAGKMAHISNDGGMTWEPGFMTSIPSTRCLQVLETSGNTVLCSTPASSDRINGTIYISKDSGKTWHPKLIEEGRFSYSTVNHLTGKYYICCYSQGHHGQLGITAKIFSTEWILRVEQFVASPLPHRPVRADFPHTVPLKPVSLDDNSDKV